MAHFARIKNGVVVEIVAVKNCAIGGCIGASDPDYVAEEHANCGTLDYPATEAIGQEFLTALVGGEWKQTSYSGGFRGNFAGQGMLYDSAHDAFIAPQPYPSWALNTITYRWEAPTPYPTDGLGYAWDEGTLTWIAT